MEGAKRQRVQDLLCAQVPKKRICEIIWVGLTTAKRLNRPTKGGKTVKRKAGSGGSILVITEEFLADLRAKIKTYPVRSLRKITQDFYVAKTTILKAVGKLWMHLYMPRRCQLRSATAKTNKVKIGKRLINWMRKKPASRVLVFSDKKNWTEDEARNTRNDHYLFY